MVENVTDRHTDAPARIQFEFPAEAVARLNRMKEATGKSTYADVVRDALRVYEWFLEQNRTGYDIAIVKDDTLVKIVRFVF